MRGNEWQWSGHPAFSFLFLSDSHSSPDKLVRLSHWDDNAADDDDSDEDYCDYIIRSGWCYCFKEIKSRSKQMGGGRMKEKKNEDSTAVISAMPLLRRRFILQRAAATDNDTECCLQNMLLLMMMPLSRRWSLFVMVKFETMKSKKSRWKLSWVVLVVEW